MKSARLRVSGISLAILLAVAIVLGVFSGCGGGGSSSGGGGNPPPAQPDFSLSISPSSVTVTGGQNSTVNITANPQNGFSSTVSISMQGLPSGVSISPAQPQLTPGVATQVSIAAGASVTASTASISVSGSGGGLTHTASLSLTVKSAPINVALTRTHYLRTDAATEYFGAVNASWIVFDPNTRRFFVADTGTNHVMVIDDATQKEIGAIVVPGAFSVDETPDHSTLYVGTQISDIYAIDPVTLKVKRRYMASEIGHKGFSGNILRVLSTGKLAMVGGQGGIQSVDGYTNYAVWNPVDNSLVISGGCTADEALPWCGIRIGGFTLSGDRKRILLGSIDSDGTLMSVDPETGKYAEVAADGYLDYITPTPDGKKLLLMDYANSANVRVYDAATLDTLSTFPVLGNLSPTLGNMLVSPDSSTLYTADTNFVYGYDIASGRFLGWTPNLVVVAFGGGLTSGPVTGPAMQAMDNNGLIVGPMGEGVGFIDTTALHTGTPGTAFTNSYLNPATGPVSGGTASTWVAYSNSALAAVYFGPNQATNFSQPNGTTFSATSPAGSPGPVDIYSFTADGGEQILPEAFSYGPTIIEVTPDSATAEGGGLGVVFGYGFGTVVQAVNNPVPSDLQVTIGGKPANITAYLPYAYGVPTQPFPLQAFVFTIPPGTAGSSADVTVTTSSGTTTLTHEVHYLAAVQPFGAGGMALAQGVYDAHRDVYYFSDAAQIRVFSRTRGWLAPIAVPAAPAGAGHRLWGISLSPDGSKLAVADRGPNIIYLLNPDSPSAVKSFAIPGPWFAGSLSSVEGATSPAGVAVTDGGIIFFAAGGGDGFDGFFSLDSKTGNITDYRITSSDGTYLRAILSADNSRVYFNDGGRAFNIDTATGAVTYVTAEPGCCGDDDLALSSDQTNFEASSYLYDSNLNARSALVLNDRERMTTSYVYGAKLSPDGSLLFYPSTNGIDVFDGRLGTVRTRISLPFSLSRNYDALVSDGKDNVLVAITGVTGNGVAVIDLSALPEPDPLPYLQPGVPGKSESDRGARTISRQPSFSRAPLAAGPHIRLLPRAAQSEAGGRD